MASVESALFCMLYVVACFVTILVISISLGEGISDSYGGKREPSYDEAARMAGYFDSKGVYQGGQPKWKDWSEDSYNCTQASQNESYCQAWTTERYYSDPGQQFLKGNCTCIRPLDESVELTFGTRDNLYEDSLATSSSEAALQDAEFCSAWNCHETRYTKQCSCTQYESRTSCSRRQLRTTGNKKSGGTTKTCSTYQVCVATSCVYIESNFYTACDCDNTGQKRAEWGPDWWKEFTHCENFTCLHSTKLITMNEGFALSSSAPDSASLPPENAPLVPINPTVVTGRIDDAWAMDYTCTKQTQGPQENGSVWCGEWSGITREEGENVVEQLCGCTVDEAAISAAAAFCKTWTCTTYYMDACKICRREAVGIVIAAVILIFLVPIVSWVVEGHIIPEILAMPFGVAAASLVAALHGGWDNILRGVLPALFLAVSAGWYIGKKKPRSREGHGKVAPKVKDTQVAPTPLQTPLPVTDLGSLSQMYKQTALTAEPAQQPGISYGVIPDAYGDNPVDVQHPSPANQYGHESPPLRSRPASTGLLARNSTSPALFKTGVNGGPGGY